MVSKAPLGDKTANLQPVRKAGSNPKTLEFLIGGVKSKCSKLSWKVKIALLDAVSVNSLLISLSTLGKIKRFRASFIAALTVSQTNDLSFLINLCS